MAGWLNTPGDGIFLYCETDWWDKICLLQVDPCTKRVMVKLVIIASVSFITLVFVIYGLAARANQAGANSVVPTDFHQEAPFRHQVRGSIPQSSLKYVWL